MTPRVCLLGKLKLHHGRWFTPPTEHSCGGPYFVKRGSIKHTLAATVSATTRVEQAKGAHDLDATIADMQRNRAEKRRLMAKINALDAQHTALSASTLPLGASSSSTTHAPSPTQDKVRAWRRPLVLITLITLDLIKQASQVGRSVTPREGNACVQTHAQHAGLNYLFLLSVVNNDQNPSK